ncbi:MAG: YraN family protein [Spirochaetia bacterium]
MKGTQLGRLGEDRAEGFLEDNGFTVIERNYRTRRGEIDAVAVKNGVVHFIEIKSYINLGTDALEYAVGKRKQATIIGVSKEFLYRNRRFAESFVQYDVLFLRGNELTPELLENVFTESGVA